MMYYGFDKIIKMVHTDKRCPAVRRGLNKNLDGDIGRNLRINTFDNLSDAMLDGYVQACPFCFRAGGAAFTIKINNHIEQFILTCSEINALVLMGDYMALKGTQDFSPNAAMLDGKIKNRNNWYMAIAKLYSKGLVERKQYCKSSKRLYKERVRCFTPYGAAVYTMYKLHQSGTCLPTSEYQKLK